jgi:glutathione S-transferase
MPSQIKPIKVWGQGGPNPPKVSMILEELDLPYEAIPVPLSDVKKPEYLVVNPNGRIPAIHDPNTGITLWESGAIIEYLIERYDTSHRLSFAPGTPESYHAKQWLYFQVTGQGPYYGQAAWFKKFHSEHVPSALERYSAEVNRVSGVLDKYLAQQKQEHGGSAGSDGPWLVGNKLSYADIAFISWQTIIAMILEKDEYNEDNFPHVKEWLGKMISRKAVKTVLASLKRAT